MDIVFQYRHFTTIEEDKIRSLVLSLIWLSILENGYALMTIWSAGENFRLSVVCVGVRCRRQRLRLTT